MLEKNFKPNHLAKHNRKNGQDQQNVVFLALKGHFWALGHLKIGLKGHCKKVHRWTGHMYMSTVGLKKSSYQNI
jgi:hypothetical protein